MTNCYTWEWTDDVAVLTMLHRLTLVEAEELEVALPSHYASRPHPGRPWGLVVDMRDSGVLDVPAQAVIKRIMIANVQAGCDAKAMVVASMVGKLQSKRLGQEAEQQSGTFDSVSEALAWVQEKLTAALR